MDSAQLFKFLSRPRTVKEVAEHFGVTAEDANQLLHNALESDKIALSRDEESVGTLSRSGAVLAFLSTSSKQTKGLGMPKIRPRIRNKNEAWGSYQGFRFKFKEAGPSIVKQATPSAVFTEMFEEKENGRRESLSHVSLSLEARLLDSLTTGPKNMMDLRVALGLSQGNIGGLVRKGLVESFWGPRGVGRTFRITKRGLVELKRLKTASSIKRKMTEKRLISTKRITPQIPVLP